MVNHISFESLFRTNEKVTMRIVVTNICNLHCTFCDVGCDLPIKKSGEYVFRKQPFMSNKAQVQNFCSMFEGVGEENLHVLQGGEVTMLPIDEIIDIIDIFFSYGRRVGLKTTGYNISKLPTETLNKISHISLTDHGINKNAIEKSKDYLEKLYKGDWEVSTVTSHRDTREVIRHNQGSIEEGLSCDHLLSTLTLIYPVIYPCCNSWAIMHNLNDDKLKKDLIEAGWTINNPNLLETIKNWKSTLPKYFFSEICAKSCYQTYKGEVEYFTIQPSSKDKVLRYE